MFQGLMPLLSQRIVILIMAWVTDEEVCVNVIPEPLKTDQQSDNTALTTPLAVTGTHEELDEQLPRQSMEKECRLKLVPPASARLPGVCST